MPFQQGNSKLGRKIWTFSIPAGDSCPYKSEACSKECYAADGFFLMPNVKKSLNRNWDETRQSDFADKSIAQLQKSGVKVCRVHVAGDLYDVGYAEKWLKIFKSVPQCRFFIYTRSWRGEEFKAVLRKMARLPNVKLWYSVDKDTGKPKSVPKNVRLAYMQVEHEDVPKYRVDLVFRVDRLKDRVVKRVNNAIVCPVENGATKDMNCMKCGICWKNRGEVFDWSKTASGRIPLLMVS